MSIVRVIAKLVLELVVLCKVLRACDRDASPMAYGRLIHVTIEPLGAINHVLIFFVDACLVSVYDKTMGT